MALYDIDSTSPAALTEAARLAAASYENYGLSSAGLERTWVVLDAAALGFQAGVDGTMTGGTFVNEEAAAQVYWNEAEKRIAISFRGTDSKWYEDLVLSGDFSDYPWLLTGSYIYFYEYLLERVAAFASDRGVAASSVLVTGHSLGAGAATQLRDNALLANGFFTQADYITFASPIIATNSDVINIGFDNDVVYKIVSSLAAGENTYPNSIDRTMIVTSTSSAFSAEWTAAHDKQHYIDAMAALEITPFLADIRQDDHVAILASRYANVSFTQILGALPWTTPVAYVGNAVSNLIVAGQGADRVFTAAEADTVNAGSGADQVWGGTGNDVLRGQAGADTLRGGPDQDLIYGGTENDALHGEDGNDWLQGQEHNDSLFGGIGVDTLFGEAGNDTLDGGAATDRLIGGIGDDLYIVDADVVVEHAGEGIDLVRTTNVSFGLSANVEHLVGMNALGQRLVGNSLDNWIAGSIGNDMLNGATGHDTLNGGMGADRLIGGLGNDRFVVDHVQDVVVEFSDQGFDTVVSHRPSYTLGLYVEDLESGDATSRTLIGNGYSNWITGHAGADTLNGAGGNDVLTGRGGNDRMIGGPGDDFYYVEGQNDVVVEYAGQGIDTINTTSASYRLPNFVDDLDAGYFTNSQIMNINTNRSMIGNNLDNIIRTNYGNDAIYGLGGSDTIYASDGRDLIVGGSGADVLYGGAGDDVFIYGSALDAPLGTAFTLIETLRDFQNGWFFGNDRIDLSRIDARAGGTVNEAFVYIGSWWFSGQAGELRVAEEWRWHTDGIYRWVQIASGDVNGDAYADFEIAIQTSDLPDIDWFIL